MRTLYGRSAHGPRCAASVGRLGQTDGFLRFTTALALVVTSRAC